MDSRRAGLQQIPTLLGGVFDSKFGDGRVVMAQFIKFGSQSHRDTRAAQRSEALNLRRAQDWDDSGDERHFHPLPLLHVLAEFIEIRVIEKQLGDDEITLTPTNQLQNGERDATCLKTAFLFRAFQTINKE